MKIKNPQSSDASAIVVPFGKHKGKTVAELLVTDPSYADWITGQGWVAERFAELHAAILSRGAGTDDTPEHNALQAKFLDPAFRHATVSVVAPKTLARDHQETKDAVVRTLQARIEQCEEVIRSYHTFNKYQPNAASEIAKCEASVAADKATIPTISNRRTEIYSNAEFEVRGIDVMLYWGVRFEGQKGRERFGHAYSLELKPMLGDDFPTVMRQMKRLKADTLIVGQYTGRGVSEAQLRQMFDASDISVVFVQEIEEAMRRHG